MTETLFGNSNEMRIAQVRRYVTIFEVLSRMGHDYEEATQQIRCPFHQDHSPSARVYADQNKVYCFTEQKSWDVIDAAQEFLKTPSVTVALAWLEQEFGVPGVTQTLQNTIRTQLVSRTPPSIQKSVELVEQQLRSRRRHLGFERYTRLLAGLDLTVWEFSEKRIKAEQVTDRFLQLQRAAHV